MRFPTSIPTLIVASLAIACAPGPETESSEPATEMAVPAPVDAEAVRAQVARFVSAWNGGDLATVGGSLAEDAVLMQPDGPVLVGKGQIVDVIKENYDFNLLTQTATIDEVVGIGEMAYARGSWQLEPKAGAEIELPSMNGKWSAIYKRAPDGRWQTWRWMWNQPSGQMAGEAAPE
jgi:ketosteroid isomerase-like protein